jgi:hypothetical protein
MCTRKLVLIATLLFVGTTAAPARAEVGIGAFFGDPTGVDFKLDLARRSALDIVVGYNSHWRHYGADGGYAHLTYLVQPLLARGDSVLVPLRLGIGVALYDDDRFFNDDLNLGARVPAEIGLRFRSVPLEIYFEIAVLITIIDGEPINQDEVDLQGGIGLRFYL